MVEQGVPRDHDPEILQQTSPRFAPEGEGDVREPAVESLGSASVVRDDAGQTLRKDRPVAGPLVAEEPSDVQAYGHGDPLPRQVGQRPSVPGMNPGGSLPAYRTTSRAGRGPCDEGDGVLICANADEVQQLGGGQYGAGV